MNGPAYISRAKWTEKGSEETKFFQYHPRSLLQQAFSSGGCSIKRLLSFLKPAFPISENMLEGMRGQIFKAKISSKSARTKQNQQGNVICTSLPIHIQQAARVMYSFRGANVDSSYDKDVHVSRGKCVYTKSCPQTQ